jgi:PAS domain S-box-containing protein
MSARIFSAEASATSGRAEQDGEMSAEKNAFFEALVSRTDWGDMGASDHCMQLYEEDASLLDAVSGFAGTGLEAGDAAVVIATKPHRDHLDERLRAHGLDLATAREQGQYVPLDAAEMLSKIMVDGGPDERRFVDVVGGVIARAGGRYARVRIFGELVALLWAEGNGDAALRLEELWNRLTEIHAFSLLCAYPMSGFSRAVHAKKFLKICAEHSHVIPAEGYTALTSPDERLRLIAQLQQKANALEAEIAEREAVERSLRHSEQELADFFDNAAVGLHWVGPDGIILRVNQAELHLLGYAREEYLGYHIAEFHADQHVIADLLRRLHAGEELHGCEARLICKDGTIKHVLIDSNVLWEEGQFIHTRCFTRDITAQKRAEAAVQQAYAELEHRVQERTAALHREMVERRRLEHQAQRAQHFALLGRLAAGVSHEIRNPLGAVFLHVDLLEEELRQPSPNSPAQIAQWLTEIKTQLARLDDLVQDYLSLVRMANLQLDVQDLGVAVRAWAAEFQALAAPQGVMIHLEGLAELGPVAFHASTLRRAVLNLVQNALDAMPSGGTLTLAGARTATHVQLEVRDIGCGMPTERLAQIFEPLYTTKPGGTGLGLYIVQEIVAVHGGQITVQSAEGHGTTFTIRFRQS